MAQAEQHRSIHIHLSSDALDNGGFGPVGPDCYAIGYGMDKETLGVRVMSYKKDTQGFVDAIDNAYRLMRESIDESNSS